MIEFKALDFKEMLYPVHTMKNGVDIFSTFPKLKQYEEFHATLPATLPKDKIFRYIAYVYDQKSPFFTQIDSLVERKKSAMIKAGFLPHHANGFSSYVKSVLNCENEKVNKMILRYCRFQSKDFTGLIASQEAFYQMNLQLITVKKDDDNPLATAKDKAALDKLAGEASERLDEKARRFLSQETAETLHKDLWSMAEDENIMITPEDYAV